MPFSAVWDHIKATLTGNISKKAALVFDILALVFFWAFVFFVAWFTFDGVTGDEKYDISKYNLAQLGSDILNDGDWAYLVGMAAAAGSLIPVWLYIHRKQRRHERVRWVAHVALFCGLLLSAMMFAVAFTDTSPSIPEAPVDDINEYRANRVFFQIAGGALFLYAALYAFISHFEMNTQGLTHKQKVWHTLIIDLVCAAVLTFVVLIYIGSGQELAHPAERADVNGGLWGWVLAWTLIFALIIWVAWAPKEPQAGSPVSVEAESASMISP
jgi:hypothetical protein